MRKTVGHAVKSASTVRYLKASEVVMRSPSYMVQRSSFVNAPMQEWISVAGTSSKTSVSFQQVVADEDEAVTRNFCTAKTTDDSAGKEESAKKSGADTKMHFEFVGLSAEGNGVAYRKFRMMPAKDFLIYMGAEEATKKPSTTFEYWDNAADLQPHRLVTPDGTVVVYDDVQEATTDADVEKFLKGTVNATKFGSFSKPYKFTCDEAESGAVNVDYGKVPQITAGDTDVSAGDFDVYVR